MKKSINKQRGLNLMELMLVFIILLAIFATAFVVYPRVVAAREANSATQTLSAALAQVKGIFPNGTYGGLRNSMSSAGEIFPKEMDLDYPNGVIMNNFGDGINGNVTIYGSNSVGNPASGNGARFVTIIYNDIPSKVCLKFIPGLAANWGRIAVNSVETMNKYDGTKANDYINEAIVAEQCNLSSTVTVAVTSN